MKKLLLFDEYLQSLYVLLKDKKQFDDGNFASEERAWQQAPDPLTDANVYMALVDEMIHMDMQVSITVDSRRSSAMAETRYAEFATAISSPKKPGRAICEVYCQVKEGK